MEDEGVENQGTGNGNGDDGGGDDGQDNDDEVDDLDGEEDNNNDMMMDSKEGTSSKEKTPVSRFGQNTGYQIVSSNLQLEAFMDQERQLVLQMEGNVSKLLVSYENLHIPILILAMILYLEHRISLRAFMG